jgi:mannose-6-phosphate isomerase-like protein (cupin superfamily)
MSIPVYDYRADLTNLVVQPEIRSRFRRVERGPVPEVHSHDLGGETFVVMEGQIEFTVADESVVCQQGQAIFVPPRTTHAVRAVGERTGVIYLSVSPHVEPTHTFYGPDHQRLPPRYGVWRVAGGGDPLAVSSPAALLESYRAASHTLAELARASLDRASTADGSAEPVKATVDAMWDGLRPLLEQVTVLERAWNALAQRAAG